MDKILIAEDDRIFQGFLRTMLQKYRDRFEVISANNGEEAIGILKKKDIALLVTDIVMPKIDGMVTEALDSFLREQKIED